jgi:hypothetical protein
LALCLGGAGEADAQSNPEAVDGPRADRVWAGCTLGLNTINAIKTAVDQGDIGTADFSFGIVYARSKPNHGQPLTTTPPSFTGPVVCIPSKQTGLGIAIEKTNEEENIPTAEDQGSGVSSVDLRDVAEAFIVAYGSNPLPAPFEENRFCHTVFNSATIEGSDPQATSIDCFRVLAGSGGPSLPGPSADRVWAGCTLSSGTVADIRKAIEAGNGIDKPNVEVSYLVVYSNNNPNNGQSLTGGGATGPVICTAPGVLIEPTTESADTPLVSQLDLSEALVIRYGYQPTGAGARTESRFCHTVASSDTTGTFASPPPETNSDCFRIYPSP